MFTTCTRSVAGMYRLLAGLTSVLSIFSITTQAQPASVPITDNNALLLMQPEATTDTIATHTNIDSMGVNSQWPPIHSEVATTANIERVHFDGVNAKKRLLQQLSDRFKIGLFRENSRLASHHFYVNAIKQELVGKGRWRTTHYELRVSEQTATLVVDYRF